jgi:hypothetical protein
MFGQEKNWAWVLNLLIVYMRSLCKMIGTFVNSPAFILGSSRAQR